MLLMKGTAATETMMNRLHHRPMRGGVSRVGERFVSSAPGQVICRTGYLVAIMALSQKDMRNENTVRVMEATVDNMRAAYDNMRKLTTILEQSSTRMCSSLYSHGP